MFLPPGFLFTGNPSDLFNTEIKARCNVSKQRTDAFRFELPLPGKLLQRLPEQTETRNLNAVVHRIKEESVGFLGLTLLNEGTRRNYGCIRSEEMHDV